MYALAQALPESEPARFRLGHIVGTPGAIMAFALSDTNLRTILKRHHQGDWGDVNEEDRTANDQALGYGGRLLSAYDLPGSERVWVITEADRSSTTFLLPGDY